MAVTIYRYRWRGCFLNAITNSIDPTIATAVVNAMPKAWMDVSLDPGDPGTPAQADLDQIMLSMGWLPFSVNPSTPLRAVTMKQELLNALAADAQTTSTVFVPLLTQAITTDTGFLDIEATIAGSGTVAAHLRLVVDGVTIANGGTTLAAGGASAAIRKRVAITPGAHSVELQWSVSAVGTCDVRPTANPDGEHASLYVAEVVS